jgi:lantibiotic transport system ATP-binding protein
MSNAIQTSALTRQFSGQYGVRELALVVPSGAIYGFVGPNGAGKTTTIRLLLNLLKPTNGAIRIFDKPLCLDSLTQMGALVESPSLYSHLSGRQNLEVTRILLNAPLTRIDEVLTRVGLRDAADRLVSEYSLGMRQRLGLALALINRPRLLILDEPSNGLDPAGILELRRTIKSLSENDSVTIFVSSHLLSEVELIATHVGVIHEGRMRFQGTLDALKQSVTTSLQIYCDAHDRARVILSQAGYLAHESANKLTLDSAPEDDAKINQLLVNAGIAVSHLCRPPITLEQLFFTLIKDSS